jgi:hypothetical protein
MAAVGGGTPADGEEGRRRTGPPLLLELASPRRRHGVVAEPRRRRPPCSAAGGVLEARRGGEPRGGRGSAMDPPLRELHEPPATPAPPERAVLAPWRAWWPHLALARGGGEHGKRGRQPPRARPWPLAADGGRARGGRERGAAAGREGAVGGGRKVGGDAGWVGVIGRCGPNSG